MSVNNVDDPAAVLAIPTDEDVEIIENVLDTEFEGMELEYYAEPLEGNESVLTKGSLIQELLAQLRLQE